MEIPTRYEVQSLIEQRWFDLSTGLRSELMAALGEPPQWSDVPPSLLRRAQAELEDELNELYLLIGLLAVRFHWDLAKQTSLFETLRKGTIVDAESAVRRWAKRESRTTAEKIGFTTFVRLVRSLSGLSPDSPAGRGALNSDEKRDRALKVFGRERAELIVTNEVSKAQTFGGEVAVGMAGMLNEADVWVLHPERSMTGPCPICQPLGGKTREVWQETAPNGPPIHVRCVCTVKYALLPVDSHLAVA